MRYNLCSILQISASILNTQYQPLFTQQPVGLQPRTRQFRKCWSLSRAYSDLKQYMSYTLTIFGGSSICLRWALLMSLNFNVDQYCDGIGLIVQAVAQGVVESVSLPNYYLRGAVSLISNTRQLPLSRYSGYSSTNSSPGCPSSPAYRQNLRGPNPPTATNSLPARSPSPEARRSPTAASSTMRPPTSYPTASTVTLYSYSWPFLVYSLVGSSWPLLDRMQYYHFSASYLCLVCSSRKE